MSWPDGIRFAFDVETSGVDVFEDRIVTACVVKVEADMVLDQRQWLIACPVDIPESATAVHGITTEHAREHGIEPAEAIEEIATTVAGVLRSAYPLIVQNAAFDLSMLDVECRRYDLPDLNARIRPADWFSVIDPMVIAKGQRVDNRSFKDPATGRGWSYKLPDLCAQFGVTFTETHDATADAIGTARLARALCHEFNVLGTLSPAEMYQRQAAWRRRDQTSFRNWVAKQTAEKQANYGEIDDGWPLHTRLTEGATV
jgi:DNA polymerase-3 subunit epsilon